MSNQNTKKLKPSSRDAPVVIRMSQEEREKIQRKADMYTGGNISVWLRYAGKLDPREEDLE